MMDDGYEQFEAGGEMFDGDLVRLSLHPSCNAL